MIASLTIIAALMVLALIIAALLGSLALIVYLIFLPIPDPGVLPQNFEEEDGAIDTYLEEGADY